ncbi:MAG: RIP metalloprotease RseP [Bacteroidetes bacterium]|nr:RIP metalloprotease RseP [Bacteroidota bacterium]
MDYIIYFVITIAILVFIHEFGHFAAAKLCKMRADVFAIGFGKRLFGWNKINGFTFGDLEKDFDTQGNTDYRLCLIPLGGYVKIAGMVDESFDTEFANEEPKPYEFRAKPTYQKLFVITAGVMMNLTLTVAIFWGINFFQGKQVIKTTTIGELSSEGKAAVIGFQTDDKILSINGQLVDNWEDVLTNIFVEQISVDKEVVVERNSQQVIINIPADSIKSATNEVPFIQPGETKPVITEVMKNSPAEDAGIKAYDLFLSLNNIPLNTSAKAIEVISSNPDVEMPLVIQRDVDTVFTKVKPAMDGKIGVVITDSYTGPIEFQSYGFFSSFAKSFEQVNFVTIKTISALGSVITGEIEFKNAFGGPVKIAQYAVQSADNGIISFLFFLAMLSLSLAIINILPFPVLDGGHFVIILVEGLLKKELPIKIKIGIQNAGFVLLLLLMAFIIYNDIISL